VEDEGTEWFAISGAKPAANPAPARADSPRQNAAAGMPLPPPRREPPPAARPTPSYADHHRATVMLEPPVASSKSNSASDLQELLDAAGIEGLNPSAELAHMFGEILRAVVTGMMEVLRGRERMKDELRMRNTSFQLAHNNPLKFSANVDDAFHNLLVKHNPAYLAPTEAFEDAMRDIRDHQAAVLAATRLAFESMLAQFDAERLQEEFDKQMKKGSILGVPAKLRYWDLYKEKYDAMTKDADLSFRKLFGEEFAKAYEEQLARLKAMKR
jgi:type VI secretion system FHA domain protein